MYITKWKKPIWKDYIYGMISAKWPSGNGKIIERVKVSVTTRG
jgi:hypothetical protein